MLKYLLVDYVKKTFSLEIQARQINFFALIPSIEINIWVILCILVSRRFGPKDEIFVEQKTQDFSIFKYVKNCGEIFKNCMLMRNVHDPKNEIREIKLLMLFIL